MERRMWGVSPPTSPLVAQAQFLFPWLAPAPPGLLATALGFHEFGRETGSSEGVTSLTRELLSRHGVDVGGVYGV